MNTFCMTPCGRRKIWDVNPNAGPTPAEKVYTGSFATKCREYARTFYPSSWGILSAKYGFLFPDDVIPGPYNVCFDDKRTRPVTTEELSALAVKKGLRGYDTIVVLGGKRYVNMVKAVFFAREVYAPLSGYRGIGYMMKALKGAIIRGVPL